MPPFMGAFPVSPTHMQHAPPSLHYRQAHPGGHRMPAGAQVFGGPIPVTTMPMYGASVGGAHNQASMTLGLHGEKIPSQQHAQMMKPMLPQQPFGFNPQMKRPSGGQHAIPNLVKSPGGSSGLPPNMDPSSHQTARRISNPSMSSPGSQIPISGKPIIAQSSEYAASQVARPQQPSDGAIYSQHLEASSESRKRSLSASPMMPRNQSVLGSSSTPEPRMPTNPYAASSQGNPSLSPAYMENFQAKPSNGTRTENLECGVGLYFKIDSKSRYYVDYIMPESSAAATGVIQPGDVLENVDGHMVAGKSWNELRRMIMGERGSFVNLSFLRELQDEAFRFDLDLTRGDPTPAEKVNRPKAPSPEAPAITAENISESSYPQVDKEKENLKKKYLAEQRLHFEAEEELKQYKEQVSMLRMTIADLQNEKINLAKSQGIEENALAAGFVPKDVLMELESRLHATEAELQIMKSERNELMNRNMDKDYVPKEQFEAATSQIMKLEDQLEIARQMLSSQEATSNARSTEHSHIEKLCSIVLPTAITALNDLSDQNGHSSSALWTLIRIEGYIASLASRIVQFDIQKMALVLLQPENARDLHESALSIAVLSWNSSGRQMLLENSMIVPALMSLLLDEAEQSSNQTGEERMLCGRYASMAIANFCLEEKGRILISREPMAIQRLFVTLNGRDPDSAIFALLGIGNLFMVPDVRKQDSLVPIQEALGAEDPIITRFAVGAVRNFATDEECREAIMKLPGLLEILQSLAKSNQPRIREHAEAALSNLGVSGFLRTSRSSQDDFMCCLLCCVACRTDVLGKEKSYVEYDQRSKLSSRPENIF
ncbi:hypothetical protein GUITHDRAFT_136223 [Guillardia theta CCMP2712]|uniref:PDZ domain-containing protein n=1 Tax=Guillardia theta (strain CCMP2712) TaxID=905079 RepID=L1JKI3_GUITC|nr:hypothetical protein GUITHDRAFT_136223 [Guillardia theta CCMP2712]EKX49038.1 hypothetical protein GUITHDRAFT_136223 [Guillardia theta CCMP2712]|eukprot:XP_005836018.1 hypothetical protein GUITHDRAFT_136223 [Guillardia theta CCMP2712]